LDGIVGLRMMLQTERTLWTCGDGFPTELVPTWYQTAGADESSRE
jgi:hypothetical protein